MPGRALLLVTTLAALCGAAGAASSPLLDATDGKLVQKQLDAAIANGARRFTLPKGNINFNASDFRISHAKGIRIQGSASTTLWFNVGAGVVVQSCEDVTVTTLAIDYWVLPYVQATIAVVAPAAGGNSTYSMVLAERSAAPGDVIPRMNLANGGAVWRVPRGELDKAAIIGAISSCPTPGPSGPFPTGLAPCAPLEFGPTAKGKFALTMPTAPNASAGDIITLKASSGHTYVVGNSSRVISEFITIYAASWMAIYEADGAGGNLYRNIKIAPDDGYLVGSNADAFHSTDVAVGPQLLDSTFTNILNDFFSLHATIHVLFPLPAAVEAEAAAGALGLVDPRAWAFGSPAAGLVDEWYGTASPMTNAEPGKDTLSCYALNTMAKVGRSVIASAAPVAAGDAVAAAERLQASLDKGGASPAIQSWDAVKLWAVELPGLAIPAGSPALLCVVDRFGGAGAKISDNVFTNGAALLGRTKSSGAVLSHNTWRGAATHSLEVAALQNFMEGPVEIANVSIVDNTFIRATDGTKSPVTAGPTASGIHFVGNIIKPNGNRPISRPV